MKGHRLPLGTSFVNLSFNVLGSALALANSNVFVDYGDGSGFQPVLPTFYNCVVNHRIRRCSVYKGSHVYACGGNYTYQIINICNYKSSKIVLATGNFVVPTCSTCPQIGMDLIPPINPITQLADCSFKLGATVCCGNCLTAYSGYVWDFGDGLGENVTGTLLPASNIWSSPHVYPNDGTYNTSLTLLLNGVNACQYHGSITVQGPCCMTCPMISLPAPTVVGNLATFSATVSANPCTSHVTSVTWDFGDGNQETDPVNLSSSSVLHAAHQYSTCSSTYTAKLTLNGIGNNSLCTQSTPAFTVAPLAGTWKGIWSWNFTQYSCTWNNGGPFTMTLTQTGCNFAGTITFTGMQCWGPNPNNPNMQCVLLCTYGGAGTVTGTISGNTVTFGPPYDLFLETSNAGGGTGPYCNACVPLNGGNVQFVGNATLSGYMLTTNSLTLSTNSNLGTLNLNLSK